MLPVRRWCWCGLGALWSCGALAQTAIPQPEIDESKIPEWVKRQARSPYKVIIDSNPVKARPAPPKDDAGTKATAKKPPLKTAVPAAAEASKVTPPLAANSAASAPPSAAAAQPVSAPAAAVETAAVPPPASESTAALAAAPTDFAARAASSEPPALMLLKRVEPVLSADLLDGRLNSAKVVVAFTVTMGGEISNLSVASTSDPRLNRSVLRAVQAWRYAPIPQPREHRVSFAFTTE